MRRDSSGNSPSCSSADLRHRLGAESRRVAERGAAHRDADRRKHRKLQLAVERQLPARRLLHRGRDVVLVVVRIDEYRDRHEQRGEQQHDDADDDAENLQSPIHGDALVVEPRLGSEGPS